jgi:sulfatase maturation enzyme AslB (radical SAM superfamily)
MKKAIELQKKRVTAAEIHGSGYCNMDCEYCFIPKVEGMKQLHKEIEDDLKRGNFIKRLKNIYGNNLESLNLWGTEPTLTLDIVTQNLEDYFENFPRLREIGFSTNFIINIESLFRLFKKLEDIGENIENFGDINERFGGKGNNPNKFTVSIQISLDGPEKITDKYRQKGATKKIIKNFKRYVDFIEKSEFKNISIKGNFKPTFSSDFIKAFNQDISLFDEYFSFFDEVYQVYKEKKFDRDVFSFHPAGSSTLMVPGMYSQSDGKEWALYQKNLRNFSEHAIKSKKYKSINGFVNNYLGRLSRHIYNLPQLIKNPEMQTCSGGDSMWAVDTKNYMAPCHRMFFMNDERYLKAIKEEEKYKDNWDVSTTNEGKLASVRKNILIDANDEFEVDRLVYVFRGFHDFTSFKLSSVFSLVTSLSKYGQASRIYYENEELATLLSYFLISAFGCSVEGAICSGSIHVTPISLVRLWANGAFEELLKYYFDSPLDAIKLVEEGGTIK